MASKYHEDWQSSKKTVLQRNAYMFDNELMSDVSFTSGESSRIFHAHKYVLATSSAVFFAMFYGNLAQKESPIRLEDTDDESFREFLRFLYTDDCKISAENAIGVMYLAKKYLVSSLAKKCVLEASINPDNVFTVLEQAMQFDEKKLEAKCWGIVSKKTQECLNSTAFCNIKPSTLIALLKKRSLEINEVDLFKAVLKWVDRECARQGINIEEDKTSRRRMLGNSIHDIYFLEMSLQDFTNHVSSSGILTETEVIGIFQNFGGLKVAGLKWKKGRGRKPHVVGYCRFGCCGRWSRFDDTSLSTLAYDGIRSDALTVTVNKAVLFHGVRLFGDSNGSQYEVEFTAKDENVTGTYTSSKSGYGLVGDYDVMLPEPISLQQNEKFTIIATIKGPPSYCGENGKSSVSGYAGIKVTFTNAEPYLSTHGTSKDRGQFHTIFLSDL